MSLILANITGFIIAHWRVLAIGAVFIVVLTIGVSFCGRGKPQVKIDQEQINKINKANEIERRAEIQKVIDQNAEVIKSVDERTTIAESNRVERERITDEKIKAVDEKIAESKKQGKDVTSEELECLLVPENCK